MANDSLKVMRLLQSVCALLVVVATLSTNGTAKSDEYRQLLHKLQGGGRRPYGMVPSRIPYLTAVSTKAEVPDNLEMQDVTDETCGKVLMIKDFYFYEFKITQETKFCATVFKPMPGSKLSITRTSLDLEACHKEYLIMADDADLQQMYCGQNGTADSFYGLDVLLLQYERILDTFANLTVVVFSKPEDPRSVSGRTQQETYLADAPADVASDIYQICPYTCGSASPLSGSARVLGGSDAVRGEYPWMAQLLMTVKAPNGSSVPVSCGASILDRYHVLTAAHCVSVNRTNTISVIVGSLDRVPVPPSDCTGTCYTVAAYVVHPEFTQTSRTVYADIAVVILRRPITFGPLVAPVCLPPHLPFINSMLTLTGFGYFKNKQFPLRLQEVLVTARENNACEEEFERIQYNYKLDVSQMCINEIWKDACKGDSGAPAVINLSGRHYQVGMVSFGLPCDDASKRFSTYSSVYTRLSYYTDFIKSVVNGTGNC